MSVEASAVAMPIDTDEGSGRSIDVDLLYADHAARLRAVIRRRVGDPHLAEDIVQETFLRACRFHDRLDPQRPAWPWLRTMALRLAVNATRGRRFREEKLVAEHAERASPGGPAEHVERAESRATLVAMLASLPERQRRLLVLRDMYGVGYDELEHSEGARVTALRMASSRAREALRRHDLVSRLGALAPFGWLANALRRVRRTVGAAGTAPAGSVVAVAVVAVVSFSVGQVLQQSPVEGPRAPAPVTAIATHVSTGTGPPPLDVAGTAAKAPVSSGPSSVPDGSVGPVPPAAGAAGAAAPERAPSTPQLAAATPQPSGQPIDRNGPPAGGLPLLGTWPNDGGTPPPPDGRWEPEAPLFRLCRNNPVVVSEDYPSFEECRDATDLEPQSEPSEVPSAPPPIPEPEALEAPVPPGEAPPPPAPEDIEVDPRRLYLR